LQNKEKVHKHWQRIKQNVKINTNNSCFESSAFADMWIPYPELDPDTGLKKNNKVMSGRYFV